VKEIDWIKSLDRAAGRTVEGASPAPQVDVADAVMREIRSHDRPTPARLRDPLPLAALLATLAGGGAVAVALQAGLLFQDPFAGFLDAFKLVLQ
jgi:hypothetical protein